MEHAAAPPGGGRRALRLVRTGSTGRSQGPRGAGRILAGEATSPRPAGGATEPPCERVKLFKLADGLAKGAAANPREADLLLNLLQRLRELAPSPDAPAPIAITHGQYTPSNVFVAGTRAAVIDLDRLCYSDPAKDVAMFLYRLRITGARNGAFERAS